MNRAEDCMFYNQNKKSYKCQLGIVESFEFETKYNCKKNGVCSHFKTNDQHEKEIAIRKEERDLREYNRLKEKYGKTNANTDGEKER